MAKPLHSKIKDSKILSEFPTLEDLMKSKPARAKAKSKKNHKKLRDFRSSVNEQKENNGEFDF